MPKQDRKKVVKRARKLGLRTYNFYRNMEKLLAAADVVVSMGGYNTICELLSLGTVSLIVPRETPRKEQLIRAKIFHRNNLVEYIPWHQCTSEQMRAKVFSLLENPAPFKQAISHFKMNGIRAMQERLKVFRGLEPLNTCEPAVKVESSKQTKEALPAAYIRKVV
jgi:predicted glycosyltransferase